jgi:hypothetical protein
MGIIQIWCWIVGWLVERSIEAREVGRICKGMGDGVDSVVEKVMGKENDFDFATGNHIEKGGQGPVMDGQTSGKTLCAHSYRLASSNNCPNRSLTSATSSVKMLARSR